MFQMEETKDIKCKLPKKNKTIGKPIQLVR